MKLLFHIVWPAVILLRLVNQDTPRTHFVRAVLSSIKHQLKAYALFSSFSWSFSVKTYKLLHAGLSSQTTFVNLINALSALASFNVNISSYKYNDSLPRFQLLSLVLCKSNSLSHNFSIYWLNDKKLL